MANNMTQCSAYHCGVIGIHSGFIWNTSELDWDTSNHGRVNQTIHFTYLSRLQTEFKGCSAPNTNIWGRKTRRHYLQFGPKSFDKFAKDAVTQDTLTTIELSHLGGHLGQRTSSLELTCMGTSSRGRSLETRYGRRVIKAYSTTGNCIKCICRHFLR